MCVLCDFVWLCSRRSSSARPHVFKGVPGFWDQSAIPNCGFQVQFSSLNYCCSLEMIHFSCIHSLVCRECVSSRLTEITPKFRISSVRLWVLLPSDRLSVCKTENSGESSSREYRFKVKSFNRQSNIKRQDHKWFWIFSTAKKKPWRKQTKRDLVNVFYSMISNPLLLMMFVVKTLALRCPIPQYMAKVQYTYCLLQILTCYWNGIYFLVFHRDLFLKGCTLLP